MSKIKYKWLRRATVDSQGRYKFNPKTEFLAFHEAKGGYWIRKLTPEELTAAKVSAIAAKKKAAEQKKRMEYLKTPLGQMEQARDTATQRAVQAERDLVSFKESSKSNQARVVELTKERDNMVKARNDDQATINRLKGELINRAQAVAYAGQAISALGPVFESFSKAGATFHAIGQAIGAGGKTV